MEFLKRFFCIVVFSFSVFNFCIFAEEVTVSEEISVDETASEEETVPEEKSEEESEDDKKSEAEGKSEDEKKSEAEEESEDESENKEKIPQYESIIDESNRLHLYSYKDENLEYLTINNKKADDKKIVTAFSKNRITRYFYDSDFYLSKIEIWQTGETAKDAVLQKVIFYEFTNKRKNEDEENKNSYSKKVLEYDLIKQIMTESYYNNESLVSEKKVYDFIDVEEKSLIYKPEFTKRMKLSYSYIYKYDLQDRIIMDSVFHYEYKSLYSRKVIKKSYRKNVYDYVRVDCPPVTSFYENDVLRMKTVYTSNDDYVTYVYFDNNTYVKVEYRKTKKYSETFYVNQEEKFKKIYE